MSGIVANIRQCQKCKNIYDANTKPNMLRCPYCFHKQEPVFYPFPTDKKKSRILSWPF